MRKFLPILLLCLLPSTGRAEIDVGFRGYLDLRLVAPGDETSWLDGGLGKLRYGKDNSNAQFAGAIVEGHALLTPELLVVAVARAETERRSFFDALEGYIRYRPVSATAWRYSVKAGAFFAPFSLENTELGWSSYWTITPSAINSWFGDELRTIGAEGSADWRTQDGTLRFTGALFGVNDPAGVMIADRGWTMDDTPASLFDHLRLPDATVRLFGGTPPGRTPLFEELDDRPGWYGGLSWDDSTQWHVEIDRYDNEADPAAHDGDYFAWRTRFWNVGVSWTHDEFTVLSQGLRGDTAIVPFPGFESTTDFDSAYLLVGWERDDWRLAVRGDWFRTKTSTTFGDSPLLGENGNAATGAISWLPRKWLRLTGEVLWIDSRRDERSLSGIDPRQSDVQAQLSARIYYN